MSSSLENLMRILTEEIQPLKQKQHNSVMLDSVFEQSIKQTMEEIKNGADSREFEELVIVNFIINAYHEGFNFQQINSFVKRLIPDEEE